MDEYTLEFEIKLITGMALTSIWVHTSNLNKAELDTFKTPQDPNVIKGKIKISIASNKSYFSLSGSGNQPGLKGTFNFTLNEKKVFKEDQDLTVNPKGRICYSKSNITLPI